MKEDGAKSEAPSAGESLGWRLPMGVNDAFELFVEVLDGDGAQFVEDLTDWCAGTGMWIAAVLGDDQAVIILFTQEA